MNSTGETGGPPKPTDSPSKSQILKEKIKSVFRSKQTEESKLMDNDTLSKKLIHQEDQNAPESATQIKVIPAQEQEIEDEEEPFEGEEEQYEPLTTEEGEDPPENQVDLSLCKSLIHENISAKELEEIFYRNKITFEQFKENPPMYLSNPELMIRMHDGLYLPDHGIAQIISLLAFNKMLTVEDGSLQRDF